MITSVQGLAYSRQAIRIVLKRDASEGEARVIDGISELEASRGAGWRGAGAGSNNMGAVQCGSSWTGARFSYTDTRPNPDGTSTPYRVDFRKYPTPLEGYVDLVKVAFVNRDRECVREAADAQLWDLVSEELHRTGYYEGFGKTVSDRIANHCRALTRAIFRGRGEQAPRFPFVAALPLLVKGCHHTSAQMAEAVRLLQVELGLAADGAFGPVTEGMVKRYQRARGLTVDGKVGDDTWRVLLGDDYAPEKVEDQWAALLT